MRAVLGMVGVGFMAFGVWLLADLRELADVLVWLGAAVVLHDGVVVPLVLAVGAVVGRGVVRGALVVAGAVTVVASPVLLRPGRTANPSVLPLDYGRNWVLAMVAVGVVAGVWSGVRWLRRGRRDGAQ